MQIFMQIDPSLYEYGVRVLHAVESAPIFKGCLDIRKELRSFDQEKTGNVENK
jgi:hypothetical protein